VLVTADCIVNRGRPGDICVVIVTTSRSVQESQTARLKSCPSTFLSGFLLPRFVLMSANFPASRKGTRETGHPAGFVERIPCGVRRWRKRTRGPSTAEGDSKGESRSFAQDDNFQNRMTMQYRMTISKSRMTWSMTMRRAASALQEVPGFFVFFVLGVLGVRG
jgi:hypothetical protein